jgi:CBS domain-containing protein
MLTLRDIMTSDVITVPPDLTLRDTMALFSSRHISGAPVVAGNRVLGVVTATDLMEFAAGTPGAPTQRDTSGTVVPLEEGVADEIAEDDMGVEGGEPPASYFTTMWEDAGADVLQRIESPEAPEWSVLDEHVVSEAMTTAVNSLSPGTSLSDAADYMRRTGVHRILVMQGDELLGIATTTDISEAVARGLESSSATRESGIGNRMSGGRESGSRESGSRESGRRE